MADTRTYEDADLESAVAAARSWRGVLRHLGLKATSAAALRSVRAHAERLGLDHSHFSGQRRWSDSQLTSAVRASSTWAEVADSLGLAGGSSATTLRGHAARLGLDTAHLSAVTVLKADPASRPSLVPDPLMLHRAGPMLAAGCFQLCGCEVTWPLEPAVYDLVVRMDGGFRRVQVKTTTVRHGSTWDVTISRSGRDHEPYDPEEIDYFFIIDGSLCYYLIPVSVVAGLRRLRLSRYVEYALSQGSGRLPGGASSWAVPARPSS